MKLAQPIILQQIRLLKYESDGLSSYYSFKQQAICMNECQSIPTILRSNLTQKQIVKRLLRLPSNNIMIVIMIILEAAFENKNNQHLLNRIKRVVYNENMTILDLIDNTERSYHNEKGLKKLFVQFFHLVASTNSKNQVEKNLYKYPIMQCAFILLCRKILFKKGIKDAQNLQLPVPTLWIVETLCQVFEIDYKIFSSGSYQISKKLLVQDEVNIYKICQKQQSNYTIQDHFNKIFSEEQVDDSQVFSILSESKMIYLKPLSSSKSNMNKSNLNKHQQTLIFSNYIQRPVLKNSKSLTPLSFVKHSYSSQKQIPSNITKNLKELNHLTSSQKLFLHQKSASVNNLFNFNKTNSNIKDIINSNVYATIQRKNKHYQHPQRQYLSPKIKNNKILECIPRPGSPLTYLNESNLSKDYNFMNRRWNFNPTDNIEYKIDSKNYQYGY